MAANQLPIFPRIGKIGWATLATANTALDGTGTVATVFTADATNGSRADILRIRHLGTNIATVLRVFINNGNTNATATNNTLFTELTIAANTISQVAQSIEYEIALDLVLPAGYKIMCTIGTTIAAGIALSVPGGDY